MPVAANAVLISEILYDASTTDTGNVFVELYGAPGTDLTGWSLQGVNGVNSATFKAVALSGLIPPDGVFTIGDLLTGGGSNVVNTDLITSVDFQNGPEAPAPAAGSSLARNSPLIDTGNNLSDFIILAAPTPGTVPLTDAVAYLAVSPRLGLGAAIHAATGAQPVAINETIARIATTPSGGGWGECA